MKMGYTDEQVNEYVKYLDEGYGGKIQLGEIDKTIDLDYEKRYQGELKIERETDKAILLTFKGDVTITLDEDDIIEEPGDIEIWMPKSQIVVGEHFLHYKGWLKDKHNIFNDLQIHGSYQDGKLIISGENLI